MEADLFWGLCCQWVVLGLSIALFLFFAIDTLLMGIRRGE